MIFSKTKQNKSWSNVIKLYYKVSIINFNKVEILLRITFHLKGTMFCELAYAFAAPISCSIYYTEISGPITTDYYSQFNSPKAHG